MNEPTASTSSSPAQASPRLEEAPTDIRGLDEVMNGGLLRGPVQEEPS
ncbi:MAG TPA: hypothetical protein VIK91_20495 [Nannocystis sp.]